VLLLAYLLKDNIKNDEMRKILFGRKEEFSLSTFKKDVERAVLVNDYLNNMLNKCHADRVSIFEFHNGSYSGNGLPFKKFSCTFEYVRKGISREMLNMQNMKIDSFPYLCEKLLKNEKAFEINIVEEEKGKPFREIMDYAGTTCVIVRRIVSDNNLIGFVTLEFLDTQTNTSESVKTLNDQFLLIERVFH
jgi:hypothetical protein